MSCNDDSEEHDSGTSSNSSPSQGHAAAHTATHGGHGPSAAQHAVPTGHKQSYDAALATQNPSTNGWHALGVAPFFSRGLEPKSKKRKLDNISIDNVASKKILTYNT